MGLIFLLGKCSFLFGWRRHRSALLLGDSADVSTVRCASIMLGANQQQCSALMIPVASKKHARDWDVLAWTWTQRSVRFLGQLALFPSDIVGVVQQELVGGEPPATAPSSFRSSVKVSNSPNLKSTSSPCAPRHSCSPLASQASSTADTPETAARRASWAALDFSPRGDEVAAPRGRVAAAATTAAALPPSSSPLRRAPRPQVRRRAAAWPALLRPARRTRFCCAEQVKTGEWSD
jgi:hypothetical protein